MIVYLSGGSEIAETGLDHPAIMLSFGVCAYDIKKQKPKKTNARLKRAMKNRWNKTERRKKCRKNPSP